MWVWRDYFPPHFLFLLFSLLNQTVKNTIFYPIFLSLFSILPIFTLTKYTLKKICLINTYKIIFLSFFIGRKGKGEVGSNNSRLGNRDGNGAGRGRKMRSSSPPRMVLSCPIPVPPRITGNTFSPHPRPLGPREAPPRPVKLYFLLICPTTSTIFFNETYFINKNIFEITNLSH